MRYRANKQDVLKIEEITIYLESKFEADKIILDFNKGSIEKCKGRLRVLVRMLRLKQEELPLAQKWYDQLKCGEAGDTGAGILKQIREFLAKAHTALTLKLDVAEKELVKEKQILIANKEAAAKSAQEKARRAGEKHASLSVEIKAMFKEQTKVVTEAGGDLLSFVRKLKFGISWNVPLGLEALLNPKLPGLAISCAPLASCIQLLVKVKIRKCIPGATMFPRRTRLALPCILSEDTLTLTNSLTLAFTILNRRFIASPKYLTLSLPYLPPPLRPSCTPSMVWDTRVYLSAPRFAIPLSALRPPFLGPLHAHPTRFRETS